MTVIFEINGGRPLQGQIRVPGDKSISHRAIMFGALADGVTEITGFLEGEDNLATLRAFRAMGVTIDGPNNGRLVIYGVGMQGLRAPVLPLDLGNSGTALRLMTGLLAGQSFDTQLIGDVSLSKRPMRRVIEPLTNMGALIAASPSGTAPLLVHGGKPLHGIEYRLPVASAQVKSALLLAGLYAHGQTTIIEPAASRDHTERMLEGFGYNLDRQKLRISLHGGGRLRATNINVPADLSSAAFFIVGAAITPESDLTLTEVGINPTRSGLLSILRAMGANLEINNERNIGGEPVADLRIRYAPLHGINIPQELVPLAIDEFPILFIAAACATGVTVLAGAAELRVKESDRIQTMADGLAILGINASTTPDGIFIHSGLLNGGTIDSHGDHRVAMAFAVAALRATSKITILDCANVDTSFPNFVQIAQMTGINILKIINKN